MAVAFGTSGLRGPAADFTDFVCTAYTTAFLEYCSRLTDGRDVYLAADLRDSSPTIAGRCMAAEEAAGWTGIWAGNAPTPAVAFHAMTRRAPAIMIPGSHIPETYNGIKFYRPDGEFLKDDEAPFIRSGGRLPREDREFRGVPGELSSEDRRTRGDIDARRRAHGACHR